MSSNTYTRAAESLAAVLEPRLDDGGLDYGPVLKAMSGMTAGEIDRMRAEVLSLAEAGYATQAAERLRIFLRPKFKHAWQAREAYERAMQGRAA